MHKLILALTLVATPALAVSDVVMHRDPGCGCCEKWAKQVKAAFGGRLQIIDDANRAVFQRKIGLPASLASCHTAIIDGIAFEGHVPIADMKRVLAARPNNVRGLAVPGMPMGSPGMEVPGAASDHFNVVAFGVGKPAIFARH